MTALQALNLQYTPLSGSIPSTLGALTQLTSLLLTGSALTSTIPSTLGLLTSLVYVHASSMPGCYTTSNIVDVVPPSRCLCFAGTGISVVLDREVDMAVSQVSGALPDSITALTKLT